MRRFFTAWLLVAALSFSFGDALAESSLFEWTVRLGGDRNYTLPTAMAMAPAGGVFVVGHTTGDEDLFGAPYGGADAFVARVSPQGELLWASRYGGSEDDIFSKALALPDGGCIALGTTYSTDLDAQASRGQMDAFLVRLAEDGSTVWIKCLGGTLDDELLDIVYTEDGDFFACGRTRSRNGDLGANMGGWDAWATLLSGDEARPQWVVRYGDAGDDQFTQVIPSAEGWMLLAQLAQESDEIDTTTGERLYQDRPVALMLSYGQEELWQVTLGGTGVNRLHSAVSTDTGWVFIGETNSRSVLMPTVRGGMDVWALNLRQAGTMAWQRAYGGSENDYAHRLLTLPGEGGYVLLGSTYSSDYQVKGTLGGRDVWVIRLSASGVLEWQQALGGSQNSYPVDILTLPDGGYLVAGTTESQDGDFSPHPARRTGFLARLAVNGNLIWARLTEDALECSLLSLQAEGEDAYLLGISESSNESGRSGIWLSKLSLSGLE